MSPGAIRLTLAETWAEARRQILEHGPWTHIADGTRHGVLSCGYCRRTKAHCDMFDHEDGCLYVLARDWQERGEGDEDEG